MNSNLLKDYMDLDEFLAVKDLCTGLSRTESDYSEDEIDQDIANLVGDEDIPTIYGLPSSSQFNTPQLSPSCFGSDTDEGRGESVSSENPASISSSESLNSNENDRAALPRKRKRKSAANDTQKAAPRRRRRKADSAEKKNTIGASSASEGEQYKPSGIDHRSARQSVDEESKDDKYWERRRKNNQAAKKSRDLKRQKEISVAERAVSLEEENRQLREEVKKLKDYLKTMDDKVR